MIQFEFQRPWTMPEYFGLGYLSVSLSAEVHLHVHGYMHVNTVTGVMTHVMTGVHEVA